MMGILRALLSSKFTTVLALIAAFIGLLTNPDFAGVIPADWSAWLASVGTVIASLSRALVDADGNGIPDIVDGFTGRRGNARPALLALLVVAGVTLACVARLAAAPFPALVLADARVGAVCSGPASMTGCLISVYDSTAGASLAANVAVPKGDTLWRNRPCTINETVVIGAAFVGTAPNVSPSAPVGARGTGQCTAQAGQPAPVIVIEIVP
jgi:hypothetical protein